MERPSNNHRVIMALIPLIPCSGMCPNKDIEGYCVLITQITTEEYYPTQEDCRSCSQCDKPQTINELTTLVSNRILTELGRPTLYKGLGPGTRLARIIKWFKRKPPDCDCEDRAAIMDAWGIEGCRLNKKTIVHWLEESAHAADKPLTRLAIEGIITALLAFPLHQEKLEQKTQK